MHLAQCLAYSRHLIIYTCASVSLPTCSTKYFLVTLAFSCWHFFNPKVLPTFSFAWHPNLRSSSNIISLWNLLWLLQASPYSECLIWFYCHDLFTKSLPPLRVFFILRLVKPSVASSKQEPLEKCQVNIPRMMQWRKGKGWNRHLPFLESEIWLEAWKVQTWNFTQLHSKPMQVF